MNKSVDFIFDFASPNAYLAHRVLYPMAARLGAEVNLIPCLLGGIFKATGNQAPMIAFGGIKGKLDYEMLEMRRFIEKHGLGAFAMNPHFPINTLTLMRGLVAADLAGDKDAYVAAVLPAMWEAGENLGDEAVIAKVLSAAGLDAEALLTRAKDDEVKTRLADNTAAAVDRGVFGIPTFFVGDEIFFGKERLGQVEDALAAR